MKQIRSYLKKKTYFPSFLMVSDLFTVSPFHRHRGDVFPAQSFHYLHHGHGLKVVRRDHSTEKLEPGLVRQFRGGRCVAYLRNL